MRPQPKYGWPAPAQSKDPVLQKFFRLVAEELVPFVQESADNIEKQMWDNYKALVNEQRDSTQA